MYLTSARAVEELMDSPRHTTNEFSIFNNVLSSIIPTSGKSQMNAEQSLSLSL